MEIKKIFILFARLDPILANLSCTQILRFFLCSPFNFNVANLKFAMFAIFGDYEAEIVSQSSYILVSASSFFLSLPVSYSDIVPLHLC